MSTLTESIKLHGFSNQGQTRFEEFLQHHIHGLTTAQIVQMSADCLTTLEASFNEGVAFPVWDLENTSAKTGEPARFVPTIDDLIIE